MEEMNQAAMYLGIDWGGTKIEIAALDDAGNEHLRRRIATPRNDYGASVKVTADLVHEAEQELGRICPVGIGIPGSVSPTTGLIQNANSDWLIGRPLAEDLELAMDRKLRLENDANCLALSEARDWPALSMSSIPMSSSSAGACRISANSTKTFPNIYCHNCSVMLSPPPSLRPGTATPAACAVPPGYGSRNGNSRTFGWRIIESFKESNS